MQLNPKFLLTSSGATAFLENIGDVKNMLLEIQVFCRFFNKASAMYQLIGKLWRKLC